MAAISSVNATQDELRLLLPPGDALGNIAYHDYDPSSGAKQPVLPTSEFEGVNIPEDPIRLLSVQVGHRLHTRFM